MSSVAAACAAGSSWLAGWPGGGRRPAAASPSGSSSWLPLPASALPQVLEACEHWWALLGAQLAAARVSLRSAAPSRLLAGSGSQAAAQQESACSGEVAEARLGAQLALAGAREARRKQLFGELAHDES